MISLTLLAPQANPEAIKAVDHIYANPLAMLNVAGRSVRQGLRDHFQHKQETEPNKLGGKRTNFWADVARSVSAPEQTDANSVTVTIDHAAINQKVHGGTIRPKSPRKRIAIPINPIAYGVQPSNSPYALTLAYRRNKAGKLSLFLALATDSDRSKSYKYGGTQATQEKRKVTATPGTLLYLLLTSVTQKPDPTALPANGVLEAAAQQGAKDFIDQALAQIK